MAASQSASTAEMSAPESPTVPPQTPRHPAEKVLADRDALEGERKQVTILFADVVGSTALIQGLDDEEAQGLLDGAVQRMVDAVHRYDGTVSRRMGDGLMAMFGAPVAHEDHAARACLAALAMLESARGYADEARRALSAEVRIRVGLNSGGVIVRLISNDRHLDYTAMGETVHLASRMEQLAEPGTILLSPHTLALVEGYVEVRALGPRDVKGFERPIEVAELMGAGAARSRLQATAARGLTPFVGREGERAAIDRLLSRARAGEGQVVALVAEAGVGKSRLAREVTQAALVAGWRVLETGAVSYGQATAWLPVSGLLRNYFGIASRDGHTGIREKVAAGLRGLDPALAAGRPALLALLDALPAIEQPAAGRGAGAPGPGEAYAGLGEGQAEEGEREAVAWAALDPARRRLAMLDAVRRLLLRESQHQPLLLVFEDLHWIDSESQALLDSLVESLPTARILLLVNYRPEYTHGWGNKSYYTQLRVEPLGEQGAEELLAALLGTDPSLRPLTALLTERTAGNPFFLEESVRGLVETGALTGARGPYRLMRPVDDVRVPATVQAVLAARIDRLPPEDKRLLQTASVIGKDVPYRLLQAIAERPEPELQASLSRLQAGELLYPTALLPEPEYTFKHALTHDVAYGSLLQGRRKTLHARIVEAIEARYPDRLDEHVDRLAHHAFAGQRWESAVGYAHWAGRKAIDRSALREAVAAIELALTALTHLRSGRATVELAIDLRLELRAALAPLGELSRVLALLREAEALAESLGDQRRLGQASALMASCFFLLGDVDAAFVSAERAGDIARVLDDVDLESAALNYTGLASHTRGEYRRAADVLLRSSKLADGPILQAALAGTLRPGPWYPTLGAGHYLTWSLAELGRFAEAAVTADMGIRFGQTVQHPFTRLLAQLGAGILHVRKGELHAAIAVLECGLEISRAAQLGTLGYYGLVAFQASALTELGRAHDALPMVEAIVEHSAARGVTSDHLLALTPLGEALLATGRASEASEVAARALELAQQLGQRGQQAYLIQLIAAIQDRLGLDDAVRSYDRALALAEELEMRPLQARCHLGLGKLYRRVGCLDDARAELARAIAMLREMRMTFWLPETEAELTRVGGSVPGNKSADGR